MSENERELHPSNKQQEIKRYTYDYLTIIPWARVGYELAITNYGPRWLFTISYPTSANGIIVLLKMPPKYRKID